MLRCKIVVPLWLPRTRLRVFLHRTKATHSPRLRRCFGSNQATHSSRLRRCFGSNQAKGYECLRHSFAANLRLVAKFAPVHGFAVSRTCGASPAGSQKKTRGFCLGLSFELPQQFRTFVILIFIICNHLYQLNSYYLTY